MINIDELEHYLDDDTYKIYLNIFNREDELNNYIVKDTLKTILSSARIKTLKELVIVRLNSLSYKINDSIYKYNDMTIDNSIDHMLIVLKHQLINLTKLKRILDKTEDINKMKLIYLNANAMDKIVEKSRAYYYKLLKKMELDIKGITYLDKTFLDISCNETEMLFITSNIKKLKK